MTSVKDKILCIFMVEIEITEFTAGKSDRLVKRKIQQLPHR